MTSPTIPEAALGSAMDALYHAQDCDVTAEDVLVRAALEAAASHMLAEAWDEGYATGNAHNGRRDANPYRSDV